jgi:hypothetical protein
VRRAGGTLALAAALCVALAAPAGAGTLVVANTNDSGPGSLRAALAAAAPGETVVVPPGDYALTSGELTIASSITLQGAGAATTVLRATGLFRVLSVTGTTNAVTITGVTIRDGAPSAPGGGVKGGGIFAEATLRLEGAVVTHNHADSDGGPGENGGAAEGGGVFSEGVVQLNDVQVLENTASAVGAAGHSGGFARGGGVVGRVELDHVTIAGNRADARGGQGPPSTEQNGGQATSAGVATLASELPALTLNAVVFTGNTSDASAGPGESAGGSAIAGAMEAATNAAVPLALSDLTVEGNSAVAANGSKSGSGFALAGGLSLNASSTGSSSLVDSTIAGNSARAPGGVGFAEAGGVFARGFKAPVAIASSTFDGNAVEGPAAGTGGGDLATYANDTVTNTIVSAGSGPAGRENCTGVRVSLGGNVDSRDQCGFHAAGDKVDADPLLGSLGEHGGGLPTEVPTAGSPAIDAGVGPGCPPADERGVTRPQGPACDSGAVETAPASATTLAPSAVGERSALLQGVAANPDVLSGTVFFQLGKLPGGFTTLTAAAGALGAAVAGTPFAAAVAGLQPGTPYHYRLVAETPEGSAVANEVSFVTAAPPAPAAPAPVLSGLALHPRSLRAERGHGASIAASRRGGATLSYGDSLAAVTTFTVQSVRRGFKVGRGCRSSRPRHARGRPRFCTRLANIGSFSHQDAGGPVRVHFTGRVGGRPLAPGSYRLRAVARNAAGLTSRALASPFTVIR